MMAECNVYSNLWMQTEFLWNFYIFGIFSGTLGLILFCFLEARKTLQLSKGEPPFESSWKTGPRRSLQKPYNSQIKELHSNHLWCFKMWDWNMPQNRVVGKSIGTVLLRYKYMTESTLKGGHSFFSNNIFFRKTMHFQQPFWKYFFLVK